MSVTVDKPLTGDSPSEYVDSVDTSLDNIDDHEHNGTTTGNGVSRVHQEAVDGTTISVDDATKKIYLEDEVLNNDHLAADVVDDSTLELNGSSEIALKDDGMDGSYKADMTASVDGADPGAGGLCVGEEVTLTVGSSPTTTVVVDSEITLTVSGPAGATSAAVFIQVQSTQEAGIGSDNLSATKPGVTALDAIIEIEKNTGGGWSTIAGFRFEMDATTTALTRFGIPCEAIRFVDQATAGENKYRLLVGSSASSSTQATELRLVAWEF